MPRRQIEFWVMPPAVDVDALSVLLLARLGEEPARVAGQGEDFFSLRPYRQGDDVRRVHWRRSARSGRWVVIETEASRGSRVLLELLLPGRASSEFEQERDKQAEHAVAVLGSLAELLLRQGLSVGVIGPGFAVPPADGGRHGQTILLALARADLSRATPEVRSATGSVRVALTGAGVAAPAGYDAVIEAPSAPEAGA